MLEVADVFRLYGDAYLQQFGQTMPPSHRRALDDIRHCRTEVLGGHVYGCDRWCPFGKAAISLAADDSAVWAG